MSPPKIPAVMGDMLTLVAGIETRWDFYEMARKTEKLNENLYYNCTCMSSMGGRDNDVLIGLTNSYTHALLKTWY